MAGDLVLLAALFVQPHPGAPTLDIGILDPHLGGRAESGKGVDHCIGRIERRYLDAVVDGAR